MTDQVNQLAIEVGTLQGRMSAFIRVDDMDVLSLFAQGGRARKFIPADPAGLLPPDSSSLLPAGIPRQAMIGICGCGEAQDSSLWIQLRRNDDLVIWEPTTEAPGTSVNDTWTFELRQYLDAIDTAATANIKQESRSRLYARRLRSERDGLFGFTMGTTVTGTSARILDISPTTNTLSIVVVPRQGEHDVEIEVGQRSYEEVVADLRNSHTTERY